MGRIRDTIVEIELEEWNMDSLNLRRKHIVATIKGVTGTLRVWTCSLTRALMFTCRSSPQMGREKVVSIQILATPLRVVLFSAAEGIMRWYT